MISEMARIKQTDDHLLHEGERVVSARELPAVPAGTHGRIAMVTGLTWRRYRVDFVNGVSLNLLSAEDLSRAEK